MDARPFWPVHMSERKLAMFKFIQQIEKDALSAKVSAELSQNEIDAVSGGTEPLKPACECHTDRNNNLVCQDANGRTCG